MSNDKMRAEFEAKEQAMDSDKLAEVLKKHAAWVRGVDGGERADLIGADLFGANLIGADLSGANLFDADLSGANLSCANLSDADLSGANLFDANLSRANLSGANLSCANLSCANLRSANLRYANLRSANLPQNKHGCICRMDFGGWSICIYHDRTTIGCQTHPNESWLEWTPDSPEIKAMHSDAAEWWQVYGEAVKAAIRCVMAKAAKYETETVKES